MLQGPCCALPGTGAHAGRGRAPAGPSVLALDTVAVQALLAQCSRAHRRVPSPRHCSLPQTPATMADIPPNQTIYVNNLPEKIKKHGAPRAGSERRAAARSGAAACSDVQRTPVQVCMQRSGPRGALPRPPPVVRPLFAVPVHRPSGCCCPTHHHAELKQLLYALFGQFGKIIDVVTMRTDRLRGQVSSRCCFSRRVTVAAGCLQVQLCKAPCTVHGGASRSCSAYLQHS